MRGTDRWSGRGRLYIYFSFRSLYFPMSHARQGMEQRDQVSRSLVMDGGLTPHLLFCSVSMLFLRSLSVVGLSAACLFYT